MKILTASRAPMRWLSSVIGIVALASVALAGCGSNVDGVQRAAQQVFVFPNTGLAQHPMPLWDKTTDVPVEDGLSLDPAFAGDLYSENVLTMIQVQLFSLDANLNIIGDAAKSYDHSPDGKTWTIHLQPSMLWSDGTPLTAKDFKAGMLHDLDPDLCVKESPFNPVAKSLRKPDSCNQAEVSFLHYIVGTNDYLKGTAKDITGITVVDDQTLTYHLIQPIGFFPGLMATMASMPVEASAIQQYGSNYPLHYTENVSQSGPFRISAWQDPKNPAIKDPQHATQIVLEPNPHWWGKPVQLQKVIMPLILDAQSTYARYTAQQSTDHVDFVIVPPNNYPFVQSLSDFHESKALAVNYYGINFANAPFDNLEVREALALALNKQSLVDTFFQGANTPTNHIIPEGILGYNPSLVTPPDASKGTASLTGYQSYARQLIAHVADGCVNNTTPDWCPYVIGTRDNGATPTPITSLATKQNCPKYNVLATTDKDGTLASSQKQIVAWAPSNRPERDLLNQAAVQQWANVLCLNITSNEAIHQPQTSRQILREGFRNADKGLPTNVGLFTFGYSADFLDPQDYTSNFFTPANGGNGNNAANFGIKSVTSNTGLNAEIDIVAKMNAADAELDPAKRIQMYQQIEQQLVFQVAVIPLDQPKLIYRLQPYVKNFTYPPTQYVSDQSWSDVFIAAHN